MANDRPDGRYSVARESVPPAPVSASPVRVEVGDFRVRVPRSWLRRAGPYIVPAILSLAGTVGGWVYGYARGLQAAVERVAAIEGVVQAHAEARASYEAGADVRLKALATRTNGLDVVTSDHESRLARIERASSRAP